MAEGRPTVRSQQEGTVPALSRALSRRLSANVRDDGQKPHTRLSLRASWHLSACRHTQADNTTKPAGSGDRVNAVPLLRDARKVHAFPVKAGTSLIRGELRVTR